jgi:hypothetical protein
VDGAHLLVVGREERAQPAQQPRLALQDPENFAEVGDVDDAYELPPRMHQEGMGIDDRERGVELGSEYMWNLSAAHQAEVSFGIESVRGGQALTPQPPLPPPQERGRYHTKFG